MEFTNGDLTVITLFYGLFNLAHKIYILVVLFDFENSERTYKPLVILICFYYLFFISFYYSIHFSGFKLINRYYHLAHQLFSLHPLWSSINLDLSNDYSSQGLEFKLHQIHYRQKSMYFGQFNLINQLCFIIGSFIYSIAFQYWKQLGFYQNYFKSHLQMSKSWDLEYWRSLY